MNTFSFAFKRSLFSSTDLFDLGNQLFNCAGERVSQYPNGELVASALKAALSTMVSVTEREKTNPATVKIHNVDSIRDNELLMIRDRIKSDIHNVKDSEAREAAQVLLKAYNRHVGNIANLGLGAETKAVKHLIDEMMIAENKERCDRIGLTSLIEGLGKTQAELEALYVERTRISPVPGECTLKKAMRTVETAVRRFLGFVDVMVAADEQGTAELHSEISSILTDVEAIARARRTRKQSSGEEQQEQPVSQAA